MPALDEVRDLHRLQELIDKARKGDERYEFWVSLMGRDVYGAKIKNGRVYLCGPLSYDDIENTNHLSEFRFDEPAISEHVIRQMEYSATLNVSRAHMTKRLTRRAKYNGQSNPNRHRARTGRNK